jgi:hypothetical protein
VVDTSTCPPHCLALAASVQPGPTKPLRMLERHIRSAIRTASFSCQGISIFPADSTKPEVSGDRGLDGSMGYRPTQPLTAIRPREGAREQKFRRLVSNV